MTTLKIHKNQGAAVDRAFVLAFSTMDQHLTYVAQGEFTNSGLKAFGYQRAISYPKGFYTSSGRP